MAGMLLRSESEKQSSSWRSEGWFYTNKHIHTHTRRERGKEEGREREHICTLMKNDPLERKFDDSGEKGENYWGNQSH